MDIQSRIEAVVTGLNQDFVELQIALAELNGNPSPRIGEKMFLELRSLPLKTEAHESKNDPAQQIKLLESLIN